MDEIIIILMKGANKYVFTDILENGEFCLRNVSFAKMRRFVKMYKILMGYEKCP